MKVVLHYILDIYTSIMAHFLTNRETQLSQLLESLVHTVMPEKDRGTQLIHARSTQLIFRNVYIAKMLRPMLCSTLCNENFNFVVQTKAPFTLMLT
jgi:hypothetical protein